MQQPVANAMNMLSQSTIKAIRENLPNLIDAPPVQFDQVNDALRTYFDFYNFRQCGITTDIEYRIGLLQEEHETLVGHYWTQPRATTTVVVVHGLFDHVGIYLKLVAELLDHNFAVFAFDMPGHGLSEGRSAVIDSFDDYGRIISGCVKYLNVITDLPVVAVGQSTGAAGILRYIFASERLCQFKKVVLLAPLVQPFQWKWINFSFILLRPFISGVRRKFTVNSNDEEFNAFLLSDPLQPRKVTTPWLAAMKQWIEQFDTYPNAAIKTLIIQGDADTTVDWEINIPRIKRKLPHNKVIMVAGAQHHLVNEADHWRHTVFTETVRFISNLESL